MAAAVRAVRRVRLRSLEAHHLPDGVAIRPEPARDGLGHDHDARLRGAFRLREAAPSHDIDAEHIEVFRRHGHLVDRQLLDVSAWPARRRSAETDVSATARVGCDDAATAATDGWAVTAWSSAARRGSLAMATITVSLVRTPGSTVAAAKAPRRKMAAQIRRRADAPTWTAIRACRARPGRASLVTSPRIVRTSSRRVACSAGTSPKNTVETMAPATRNTSTRQSAAGTQPARSTSSELRRHRGGHRIERTLQKQPRDGQTACRRRERKEEALREQLPDDAPA